MDQQNKTKPEENQNKPAELSDKDLEQVAGGLVLEDAIASSLQNKATGTAKGLNATDTRSNTGSSS